MSDKVVIKVPDYGYVVVDRWSWEAIERHQLSGNNPEVSHLYQFTAKVPGLRDKVNPNETPYVRCVAFRRPDKQQEISLADYLEVGEPEKRDFL